MGKLDNIENKEDKKLLVDLIEVLIKGDRQLFSFNVNPDIEKQAKLFANRIINENLMDIAPGTKPDLDHKKESEYEQIYINSIKHEDVREIGSEWLCKQAMEQLDFKDLLINKCRFSEAGTNLALAHIVSRAVYPASENKTAQWMKDNSGVAGLFNQPIDKIKGLNSTQPAITYIVKRISLRSTCQPKQMNCSIFRIRLSFTI